MLLGVDIGLFLAGLFTLFTGTFRLTGRIIRRGAAARIGGLLLLFPLALGFGVPTAIGLNARLSGRPDDSHDLRLLLAFINVGIIAGCFLAATVIALAFGRRPDEATGTARPVPAREPPPVLPLAQPAGRSKRRDPNQP
jgi:hypothetical protein